MDSGRFLDARDVDREEIEKENGLINLQYRLGRGSQGGMGGKGPSATGPIWYPRLMGG